MNGTSAQTKAYQTVEFKGHLIDSLTLSKIADHVEQLKGTYVLNDMRLGVHRHDLSSANITIYADTPGQLQQLLDALKPYGATPTGQNNATLAVCEKDGEPPEHTFTLGLPQKVMINGDWMPITAGRTMVLVVDPETKTVALRESETLRSGEQVILGNHGIDWS